MPRGNGNLSSALKQNHVSNKREKGSSPNQAFTEGGTAKSCLLVTELLQYVLYEKAGFCLAEAPLCSDLSLSLATGAYYPSAFSGYNRFQLQNYQEIGLQLPGPLSGRFFHFCEGPVFLPWGEGSGEHLQWFAQSQPLVHMLTWAQRCWREGFAGSEHVLLKHGDLSLHASAM